jgi:hypothetical protein
VAFTASNGIFSLPYAPDEKQVFFVTTGQNGTEVRITPGVLCGKS